jgi:hypothetical protein
MATISITSRRNQLLAHIFSIFNRTPTRTSSYLFTRCPLALHAVIKSSSSTSSFSSSFYSTTATSVGLLNRYSVFAEPKSRLLSNLPVFRSLHTPDFFLFGPDLSTSRAATSYPAPWESTSWTQMLGQSFLSNRIRPVDPPSPHIVV